MSIETERQLKTRNEDLVNALKTIGRILTDPNGGTSRQRQQRVMGVLMMYECAPVNGDAPNTKEGGSNA